MERQVKIPVPSGKNLMMLFKITGSFGKHFHTLIKVSSTMRYRLLQKLWLQGHWRQAIVHQKLLNHGYKPSSTTQGSLVVELNSFFPKEL